MSVKKSLRHQKIIQILSNRGAMRIADLADQLDVTPETLRSDLSLLAQSGQVVKEHGICRLVQAATETPMMLRDLEHPEQKRRIARKALSFVKPGQVIFADSGTTILQGLDVLASIPDITVITNSLPGAVKLASMNIKLILLGGSVFNNGLRTYGNFTTETIDRLQIDVAFMGTDGFAHAQGFTTFNENELGTKRHLINQSRKIVVVSDASKFDSSAPFTYCRFSEADLFVCTPLSPEQKEMLKGVKALAEA